MYVLEPGIVISIALSTISAAAPLIFITSILFTSALSSIPVNFVFKSLVKSLVESSLPSTLSTFVFNSVILANLIEPSSLLVPEVDPV